MAEGKWIEGLTADTPLLDAARHVLFVRLKAVRDQLAGVEEHAEEDPEHVHQLRVSTRRGGAALRIFACCLPPRALRRAKKRLRGLRQAAGAARDWDVFALNLADRVQGATAADQAGLDLLAGYARGQRAAVQPELKNVAAEQRQDFEIFLTDTLAGLRMPEKDEPARLIDLARRTLGELRIELEEAVSGDLSDYVHLHQVRINGKRLRYALEIFNDCFGTELRETIYPRVEEMQEILGHANDGHVAIGRLEALRGILQTSDGEGYKRYRSGVEKLLRANRRQLQLSRKQFLQWLNIWRNQGSEMLLNMCLQPVG